MHDSLTAHSADIATAKTAAAIINADFFICNLPVDTFSFTEGIVVLYAKKTYEF